MASPLLDLPSSFFERTKNGKPPRDFTFFVKTKNEQPPNLSKLSELLCDKRSAQDEMHISIAGKRVTGRVLCCYADRRRLVSVSFRATSELPKLGLDARAKVPLRRWDTGYTAEVAPEGYLNSLSEIVQSIASEFFKDRTGGGLTDAHGLIIIAGATASAKSEIGRGLIDHYLKAAVDRDNERRPHLVTFEDPIEKFFLSHKVSAAMSPGLILPSNCGIDYTPREKSKDVSALKRALRDALRQTPKVFYVGETRDVSDWKELIHFARSGHLVVTTAHAGSLVEAMQLPFRSLRKSSPSARNMIASTLLGVAHLHRDRVGRTPVLLPALWKRSQRAVNDLTAIGLASLVPGRASSEQFCFGRTDLARDLLTKASTRSAVTVSRRFGDLLMQKAIELDMRGL